MQIYIPTLYIEHWDKWEKTRSIRWTSDISVKKNTLVNDGDVKVIANKF